MPENSWDYCFPGDELGFKWTVLVGKERKSKSWMAAAVPQKGGVGKYGTDKCLEFIKDNGYRERHIIVKNDQEVSMQYLIKDIVAERPEGRTILEESPKYSSGSNGVAERGVQEIEGKIRALYIGFNTEVRRRY